MQLNDLFADTVARHGERIAIEVPPGRGRKQRTTVSYRELERMAATVRAQLAAFVDGECVIAIRLPRATPWLFAAQLAVMQLGAAYVCLDPTFPAAHVQHVLRDAGARLLFTDADGEALVANRDLPIVKPANASREDVGELPRPAWADGDNLAYVIYTSGSTGMPKGVLLEHRGAVNLIRDGVARFAIAPGDRIAQGSSPAYDSSIEELWLAFASGATVVVLDDETVRLGPDLVPWLRAERITVLCPPPTLLRAMDCRSPRDELPLLRLCYVGGEALPADLATTWGGALWLENGYGPTECTVTVVRGRVLPGRPVTIGEPVPPHRAFVVDERLEPVVDGAPGELLIAGPGLARGYLGLPELTAQRFPTLPGIGRVYRTGDLAVRGVDGQLTCLGRIDAQVKLRGFRIELEAIEALLAPCDGVREAACSVQGDEPAKLLVAHIVPDDWHAPPSAPELAAALRTRLPEYMVPGRFVFVGELPRTVGGKVDRRRLPRVVAAGEGAEVGDAEPLVTAPQNELRAVFAAVLARPLATIHAHDDFFELGGDSLRAAMLVSQLRRIDGWQALAVTNVYRDRTIAAIAAQRPTPAARAAALAGSTTPSGSPLGTSVVQAACLGVAAIGGVAIAYAFGFVLLPWLCATWSLPTLLLVGPWIATIGFFAYALVAVGVAVSAKWLLIGRYREQRIPAWSGLHLRHWIVVRCVRFVPWTVFEGTELTSVVLRLLGARIGKRLHVHRGTDLLRGGWDLLDLGDDVTLGREAQLAVCELDDGQLVLGPVRIGNGATLETRAGTGPDVQIGDGAIVTALSFVASGARVPTGERWDGVPARAVGSVGPLPPIDVSREVSPWSCTLALLAARLLWAPLIALPYSLLAWLFLREAAIDSAALGDWLYGDGPASHPAWCLGAVVLVVLGLTASLLAAALVLRWSPKVPAGTHARWSFVHLRLQVRTALLERAGLWLSGTLFWPWWLRLAGMRVGSDCEVSTILDVLPEHVAIGSGSFLADGIYLGAPIHHAGRVTVLPTSLGERTFVGNHVVIDAGQQLPADLLLGISTVADPGVMQPGSAWFGHPAFPLPRRERIEVDRRLTHEPGALRYTNRLFWEALRLLLPALPMLLGLWWFEVVAAARGLTAGELARTVLLASVAVTTLPVLIVWALKWLLLGRVQPGQHGLWSCWASRWDFLYVVWQRYGVALTLLEGTLLLPWFLRAMGMRIGRRCLLGDGFAQVVDPDMITIEDGATVHALFQAHSFEDRVLKIDRVRIGRGATVGRGTVVLYGADIGEQTQVMPHSVVMKHELLLPDRRYAGVPTGEV